MKPEKITINKSITVNLGNYQSARIEASLTVELEPGENWASAAIRLGAMVGTIINAEVAPVLEVLRAAERQSIEHLMNSSFAPPFAPLAVQTADGSVIPFDGEGDLDDDDDLDKTEEEWGDDANNDNITLVPKTPPAVMGEIPF